MSIAKRKSPDSFTDEGFLLDGVNIKKYKYKGRDYPIYVRTTCKYVAEYALRWGKLPKEIRNSLILNLEHVIYAEKSEGNFSRMTISI